MSDGKMYVFGLLLLAIYGRVNAQSKKVQQGLCYKAGTDIRLGSVRIQNKHSLITTQSNMYGMFSLPASTGDTLEISCAGYNNTQLVVTDLTDKIIFLKPGIALSEVVIKETSALTDLNEVKKEYRKKSVFYTGTPHYYYLVLKPMTFIYENFKSEVINARKFNRYAKNELAYYEIAGRFNDHIIKGIVPIKDKELDDFESFYWPSLEQVRSWNDYDMANYIIGSYREFKNNKTHKSNN